ncbi:amidohydrolase [Phytohabitans flavus]
MYHTVTGSADTTRLRLRVPVLLPCDPTCSVLRDAVVDVGSDGRIVYAGAAATAPEFRGSTRQLTGILLPGFVNSHAHSAMTMLRGAGSDLPLMRWLSEEMWPAEAHLDANDIYDGTLLGAVEMLRNGVTTSNEMYFHPEAVARAVVAAGSRAVVAGVIIDLPGKPWAGMLSAANSWIDSAGLRHGPGERIEIAYGPHSAYALPYPALEVVAEEARSRGALVHIHVAESVGEDDEQRKMYGSVPQLLAAAGVLDGRVLAAHGVHLSTQDINLLAKHRVGVAHCPGSNAKLASGVAPLLVLMRSGVPVGLGTDGPASNDDLDVLEEARLAATFARIGAMDAAALGAAEVLLLATRGGAAALGRSDIGAVEAGRWADLVHVDIDDPAFATGTDGPDEQLLANLVWAAGARQVTDVWVAGEQVVAGGESTRVDRAQAQSAVGAIARQLRAVR